MNKNTVTAEFKTLMDMLYKTYDETKATKLYCKVVKETGKQLVLRGYKCRMYTWYNNKEKIDNNEIYKYQILCLRQLLKK